MKISGNCEEQEILKQKQSMADVQRDFQEGGIIFQKFADLSIHFREA